jgi:phage terminase small subunit
MQAEAQLTEKQKLAVKGVVDLGMTQTAALEYAGYKCPAGARGLFSAPVVKQAITERFVHAEKHLKLNREIVLDGMMEAIEMAKIQADPEVMIQGWREVGRMCGYYAPEVKKIQMDVTHKRLMSQFETLSDEELLKIAADNAKEIEGEVLEVRETLKNNSNSDELRAHVIEDLGK